MNYVVHDCRNSRLKPNSKNYCNNRWVDKDLTQAVVNPPDWKYCRECAEKLGIDYDKQTPDSNLTPEEMTHKNKLRERAKKMRLARLQKINSVFTGE